LWTRHGSTRYLWTEDDVERSAMYVTFGQERSEAYADLPVL